MDNKIEDDYAQMLTIQLRLVAEKMKEEEFNQNPVPTSSPLYTPKSVDAQMTVVTGEAIAH